MSVAEALPLKYDELLETALARISDLLKGDYGISKRTISLLLLQGDRQVEQAGFQVLKPFPGSAYPLKFFSRNICLLVRKDD